jgi:hypothetical protein
MCVDKQGTGPKKVGTFILPSPFHKGPYDLSFLKKQALFGLGKSDE